ncbi:MAG TPA: transcriptional regulator GcvA [Gammaproteobacteria bacterium]|jgi:LysR family glycine cleavage system transcriptional activator
MRDLPPPNALKAFEAAARHGNLSKAAVELHVTHGAVSRQVKQLEDFLGCELFHRLPRGLQLTALGREFAFGVQGAFDQIREAVEAVRVDNSRQVLTVSTLASLAARWLVPRLHRFQKAHPETDIRLSTSPQLTDFDRDGIDLAIRYGRGRWPGVTALRLFTPEEFPVCSPKLLRGAHPLRMPADLKQVPLLHDTTHRHWQQWLELAKVRGIDARQGLVVEDMNVLIQAAIEGQGVALASAPLVQAEIEAGRLVRPFQINLPVELAFYAVYPKNRGGDPFVLTFVDWLREEAGQMAGAT